MANCGTSPGAYLEYFFIWSLMDHLSLCRLFVFIFLFDFVFIIFEASAKYLHPPVLGNGGVLSLPSLIQTHSGVRKSALPTKPKALSLSRRRSSMSELETKINGNNLFLPSTRFHSPRQMFFETNEDEDPQSAANRLRIIHRFLRRAASPKEVKRIERRSVKTLDDMNRSEMIDLLEQLYRLPNEKIVGESVQKLDDNQLRQRIRQQVHHLLVGDEDTLALEKLEAPDSVIESRSEIGMTVPKGRTGAIVYIFNIILKKIYGYDILEKAGEEVYKEKLRTQHALELGVDRESLNAKLVENLLKQRTAKTRPYKGEEFNPLEVVS